MRRSELLTTPSKVVPAAFLRGLLGASVLAFASCAGFRPTPADQLRSLQDVGQITIAAPLPVPERGAIVIQNLAPKAFLTLVAVCIFSMRDSDAFAQIQRLFAALAEGQVEAAQTINSKLAAQRAGLQGSGVAVTGDGYFVTAAHVVPYPLVVILFLDFAGGRIVARGAPARIVFVDKATDFALLKCELATPRFLVPMTEVAPKSTLVFSGGWWNERAAGQVLESREFRSRPGHRYRSLRTSIPMRKGDSGSAVIDRDGHLLGVAINARYGRFWRMAPESNAVMLEASELEQLIKEDRAKRR